MLNRKFKKLDPIHETSKEQNSSKSRELLQTPPQSPGYEAEHEQRMQLLSMTPVPGCVIVSRDTYLGLQNCNQSRKRWSEQIPDMTSDQVICALPSLGRRTEQLPPTNQMFFAIKDEYTPSASKFTYSAKPSQSRISAEPYPQISLSDIMPDIEEESSSDPSDPCQQTFKMVCPELPYNKNNFNVLCSTFAVDLLFALKEGLAESKMQLLGQRSGLYEARFFVRGELVSLQALIIELQQSEIGVPCEFGLKTTFQNVSVQMDESLKVSEINLY